MVFPLLLFPADTPIRRHAYIGDPTSHIESEFHDIAVFHDILFALNP